jgi:hypothetical protein
MIGATSLAWMARMIVYTVRQNKCGLWSVSCVSVTLADGLQLGPAIKQARNAARTEHLASGLITRVEMHGDAAVVLLASYQKSQDTWTGDAA